MRIPLYSVTSVALLTTSLGLAINLTKAASAQDQLYDCPPTGRVEAGVSDNFERHAVLCDGHEIRNPQGMEILCFVSREFILIEDRTQTFDSSTTCSQSAVLEDGGSSVCNEGFCFKSKIPATEQFQIVQPDTVSGPTPLIEWQAVPDTQSYTVSVIGPDVRWSQTIAADETSLSYPTDKMPLELGETYEIIITANQGGLVVASASQAINVRELTALRFTLHLAASTNVDQ
ncbi:hypothetical protein [Synechococcus sp. PCC 7335]|uniref:hypothetical protein n=1 Tax=Synechococcus sp. (strain ATCC 29403 / PCC 7335) TaxID=91464 RepID=UPI0002D516BA|nr:hypothetical protein [Synechococcus sp. PCC 7335]